MAVAAERRVEQQARVLQALRDGNTRTAAGAVAGIHHDTLIEWQRKYPEFSAEVQKAEAEAELKHVANICKAAGEGSWQASAWWLERRRFEQWRRRDQIDLRVLSNDQLLALASAFGIGVESAGDRAAVEAGLADALSE
jgi:hypothetical protein